MKRQHGVSIVNALLVIGLAVSVIGLLIAAISPPAASGETRTELWINAPSSIGSMSPYTRPAIAGETRTDLWVNHPSSIGSTSRSDVRLATLLVLN